MTDTTTTLTSDANPSSFGQSVLFTAAVPSVGGLQPSGSVTFKDGATTIGIGTLNPIGTATFSTAILTVGTHPITAIYSGDTNFTTSTSDNLDQVVTQSATNVKLTSDRNNSSFGESVLFTATVPKINGIQPSGSVTFEDLSTPIGTSTLNAGIATLSTAALTVGSHTIIAVYSGDTNFTTSIALIGSRQVVNVPTININSPSPNNNDPVTPTGIQPFNGVSDGFFNLTDDNDGTVDTPINISTLLTSNLPVRALSGNDNVIGTTGADTIYGNQGNDSLNGSNGNDNLRGGKGNDVLIGGNGSDVLISDLGQDFLTGGMGADTFVLRSDDNALATKLDEADVITDFNPGEGDKIGLAGTDFSQITLQPINLSVDGGASISATVIVRSGSASYLAIVQGFEPERLNNLSLFINAALI